MWSIHVHLISKFMMVMTFDMDRNRRICCTPENDAAKNEFCGEGIGDPIITFYVHFFSKICMQTDKVYTRGFLLF